MDNKGFTDNKINIETPRDIKVAEKPLKAELSSQKSRYKCS